MLLLLSLWAEVGLGERTMKKRLRINGNTYLFHTRQDLQEIIKFCNYLADRIDKLATEINQLKTEGKYEQGN